MGAEGKPKCFGKFGNPVKGMNCGSCTLVNICETGTECRGERFGEISRAIEEERCNIGNCPLRLGCKRRELSIQRGGGVPDNLYAEEAMGDYWADGEIIFESTPDGDVLVRVGHDSGGIVDEFRQENGPLDEQELKQLAEKQTRSEIELGYDPESPAWGWVEDWDLMSDDDLEKAMRENPRYAETYRRLNDSDSSNNIFGGN